jgi:hypothetical protein
VNGFAVLDDLALPILIPGPGAVGALLPTPVGARRFVTRTTRERGWDVDTALAVLGIDRVAFDMVDGNVQGFSFEDNNGRHVALNPTAVYLAKTLLHELAHLVLGHCTSGDETHRGVAEFEAEATAYLAAKELELIGWDAAESRAYIQGWLGGTEVAEDNISRVFAAVNKILTAGRVVDVAETVAA